MGCSWTQCPPGGLLRGQPRCCTHRKASGCAVIHLSGPILFFIHLANIISFSLSPCTVDSMRSRTKTYLDPSTFSDSTVPGHKVGQLLPVGSSAHASLLHPVWPPPTASTRPSDLWLPVRFCQWKVQAGDGREREVIYIPLPLPGKSKRCRV